MRPYYVESLGHIVEEASPVVDWNAGAMAFLVKFVANTSSLIKMLGLSQEHFGKIYMGDQ
jgi:hypothetical protein